MFDQSDADVYEKHADELMRFASMLVGPSGAEDIVAEAVVRVFSSPEWAAVRQQRAYLFRAVLNQARSAHRSTQRRLAREATAAITDVAEVGSVRAEVLDALRSLDVRQRAVVFFHFWEDLPADEIGRMLDISTRTVQRELKLAQRRLEVLLR